MAITDGTFDAAEFEAAVTANPALLDHVRPGLTKLGITPYTKQQFDTALGTEIDKKTSAIHSAYEKDALELTGIPKEDNEKAYVYLKRAVGSVLTTRQNKIADLEKAISEGSTDPTLKAQLAELQKKEAAWQEEKKTYGTSLFEKDVLLDLRLGQVGLKLNEALPKSLQELAIDNAEKKVLGMAKAQTVDGKTSIVYMKNGEVVLKDGVAATAGDLLREELKDVLDAGQGGQGGGAGGQGGQGGAGGKGGKVTVPETLPGTVKNQGQLMDYLLQLGLATGTDEFDTAFEKLGKGLPLR